MLVSAGLLVSKGEFGRQVPRAKVADRSAGASLGFTKSRSNLIKDAGHPRVRVQSRPSFKLKEAVDV